MLREDEYVELKVKDNITEKARCIASKDAMQRDLDFINMFDKAYSDWVAEHWFLGEEEYEWRLKLENQS